LEIHDWAQTGKKTYIRAPCQKNEGSVGIKQRPTKMGGWTTYRTLSPKRAPFQIGINWWSHLRKVHRRRWISHTYPVWLWGCRSCKISSPGPVFHGTKWLLWRPHIQSPTLHSGCGINKGLIKRGSTIDHWRSRYKGWILWPTPYTFSFIPLLAVMSKDFSLPSLIYVPSIHEKTRKHF
jgi:hypothetical protein